MDNQSLSLQERTRQGDSILDLSNVPQGAIAEFEWAISQDDQKDILKHYRRAVRNLYAKRRRLKNPINKKTGKPLKPATLKQYQSSLATHERDVRNYKCAIQMLIFYNYLEAHKTQARWVRKLKAKGQVLDYCQGLKEDEKSFVEPTGGMMFKQCWQSDTGRDTKPSDLLAGSTLQTLRLGPRLKLNEKIIYHCISL